MASQRPNIELPSHEPRLIQHHENGSFSNASFAIYSTVPGMTVERLQAAVDKIQRNFIEEQKENDEHEEDNDEDEEPPHSLICLAKPTPLFPGKPLKDIIEAHISMDKEVKDQDRWQDDEDDEEEQEDEEETVDVGVFPHVLLVLTSEDLRDPHSLLVVFAPIDHDAKAQAGEVRSFFVEPRFADAPLCSELYGNEHLADNADNFDVDGPDYNPLMWEEQLGRPLDQW